MIYMLKKNPPDWLLNAQSKRFINFNLVEVEFEGDIYAILKFDIAPNVSSKFVGELSELKELLNL